jgi:hypothetical protein
MNYRRFYLFVGVMALSLLGCKHINEQSHMLEGQKSYLRDGLAKKQRLTKEEAIEIAKREAIDRNQNLEFYEAPWVSGPEAGRWFISFEAKPPCHGCAPALGSHFSISIDENDGTTIYSPGR